MFNNTRISLFHCFKDVLFRYTSLLGKVYNVTDFLKFHPGGKAQLMRGAGNDCTEIYDKVCTCISRDEFVIFHDTKYRILYCYRITHFYVVCLQVCSCTRAIVHVCVVTTTMYVCIMSPYALHNFMYLSHLNMASVKPLVFLPTLMKARLGCALIRLLFLVTHCTSVYTCRDKHDSLYTFSCFFRSSDPCVGE